MTVPLRRILDLPGLSLSLLTAPDGRSREVRWAHVSELPDPTRWLEGGELLLTTGMRLFGSPRACADYCARMARAGVAAIGVSVGAPLTHARIPPALVRAAQSVDLPLVLVPTATPLEAIVKGVADLLEQDRHLRLRKAFEAQRALTASAVNPGGLRGVLETLASATGLWAVVCDPSGHPLAWSAADALARVEALAPMIQIARRQGMNASVSAAQGDAQEMVLPLGVRPNLRGLLVAGRQGRIDSFDRSLVVSAVWLLTLELERRFDASALTRRVRARLLEWLVGSPPDRAEAEARLRRAGLPVTQAVMVLIEPGPDDHAAPDQVGPAPVTVDTVVADLHRCDAVLAFERDGKIRVMVFDPPSDLKERVASLIGRGNAGIGAPMPAYCAALSCRQAQRALTVAQREPGRVLALDDLSSFHAILQLADPTTLVAFTDAALRAIDQHDAQAREPVLRSTLREYLLGIGGAVGAAETLQVHRHTVRERLRLVQRLSGRDLGDPHDRFELLLAIEIRDLLSPDHDAVPVRPGGNHRAVHSV